MDKTDKAILELLQTNADISTTEIADRVGLSTTPCWRRIQRLEADGVIRQRVALLDRDALNLGVSVFVSIKTNQHNLQWLERFAQRVSEFREVVEFYRMSGETDYLMKIVVSDIDDYDSVYKKLISVAPLYDVSS